MFANWIYTLLETATVATVLTGLALFLFKTVATERLRNAIKAEYDDKLETLKATLHAANAKELEVLKAQLKGHADVELEQLKSQLQIQAAQQNLTFTRLHERRVDAIDVVHHNLIAVRDAVGRYINMFQPMGASDQEHLQSIRQAYEKFKPEFVRQQLFLPRKIAATIEDLDRTFVHVTNQFTMVVKADASRPNTDLWIKLVEQFGSEVDEAVKQLHEDMRVALGDQ